MDEHDVLAERFETHRARLRAVAYQTLGLASEADDAVQETWLRLSRSDASQIENLGGWLTTVVARVCLNMLQSRREVPAGMHLAESAVSDADGTDPEGQALLADSIGPALLVILHTLAPAERLAFVLHDMFAVPFAEIAPIVGTTPTAARQLASRARRRVQGAAPADSTDLTEQRELVDAILAASREGDFEGLLRVLDPDAVFRIDAGPLARRAQEPVVGAEAVARQVLSRGRPFARFARPAIVNGVAGVVVAPRGRPLAVVAFTCASGRIAAIDLVADPQKLGHLSLGLDGG
jgi:RNA polymerase sigma factor (sigma-70 family)